VKTKKCVDCGKIITHKNPRCFSCINRRRWKEPGRKEKQRQLMSSILRQNSKLLWEKEEFLEQQNEWRKRANEVRWGKRGAREKFSEFINAYWDDEENRLAQSERIAQICGTGEHLGSEYPFNFNHRLKEKIRQRDNRLCVLCQKSERIEGKRLSVHHIDGNKENLKNGNLISLCNSCHSMVHSHLFWFWKRIFEEIISSRDDFNKCRSLV